jgi:hypothetical protein
MYFSLSFIETWVGLANPSLIFLKKSTSKYFYYQTIFFSYFLYHINLFLTIFLTFYIVSIPSNYNSNKLFHFFLTKNSRFLFILYHINHFLLLFFFLKKKNTTKKFTKHTHESFFFFFFIIYMFFIRFVSVCLRHE